MHLLELSSTLPKCCLRHCTAGELASLIAEAAKIGAAVEAAADHRAASCASASFALQAAEAALAAEHQAPAEEPADALTQPRQMPEAAQQQGAADAEAGSGAPQLHSSGACSAANGNVATPLRRTVSVCSDVSAGREQCEAASTDEPAGAGTPGCRCALCPVLFM